jgi:hypothetical protein
VQHALFVIRCALQAGLAQEQIRGLMGGQIARLASGEEPLDLGPALDLRQRPIDLLLHRVETFLTTTIGRIFSGNDGHETLALARLACDVPPEDPRADVCASIVELLDLHDEVADGGAPAPTSRGIHLIITALCLAATPDAAAPLILD